MMKTLLLSLAFVLISSTAHADVWPYVTAGGGQLADLFASTRLGGRPDGRCSERNPRYRTGPNGNYFNTGRAARDKAILVGSTMAVVWLSDKSDNRTIRRLGKIMAYSVGGVGGVNATVNLAYCGW